MSPTVSPTVPVILAVLAAVWLVVGAIRRRRDPGFMKLALVAGLWAVVMAAWAAYHVAAKTPINAIVVIPLLVSTIVQFGMFIAAVSRVLKGKLTYRTVLAITLTIIGITLAGVVLMFQPFTPAVFNLGFDFVLVAWLAFNVWSHVTPKPKAVERE